MEYNKTLATTGSLGGLALLSQAKIVIAILLLVIVSATLIRILWRKNKSIGE